MGLIGFGAAQGMRSKALKLRVWNGIVVGYLATVIYLLTLNPFEFQAFVPSEFWVWRFGIPDFLQNILLFFPLGVVLKHTTRRTPLAVMLCGLALSLSVEVCQLFIEIRTSNFVDLISNASGAWLGGLFYQHGFSLPASFEQGPAQHWPSEQQPSEQQSSKQQHSKQQHSESHFTQSPLFAFGVPYAFMLLPFCWVVAMRAVNEPAYAWLLLPGAIAGLAVLSGALATSATTSGQRVAVIGVWAIAALAPIFPLNPALGLTFLITAPIIGQLLSTARRGIFRAGILVPLGMGLGISLTLNGVWYFQANAWSWSIPIHLRWIELGMSAIAVLGSGAWTSGLSASGLSASGLWGTHRRM